jgi:hypothetical protein
MEGIGVRGADIHFSDFTGRWINLLKIPKRDWLYILKLFELEISARKASKEIGFELSNST